MCHKEASTHVYPCGVDWVMAEESMSVDFGNYLLDAVHYLLLRRRSDAMVTFLSRDSFFGLQTSCTGAANLPLMSGAGVVHSWEGFNNISPASLLPFLQSIFLIHHENS